MRSSDFLGLNARAALYSYKYNTARGRSIASSKILTKKVLGENEIPVPDVYGKIRSLEQVKNFKWDLLPSSFVLKPSRGLGGEGIIVIKKRATDGEGWITTDRKRVYIEDLTLHSLAIQEGAYSLENAADTVLIEEYIGRHKALAKYSYRGTPDIRIIVFNKVPVMAMLRLPTKESGGRANVHQGAIAVGIDIATGITTYATHHHNYIKNKPGTKRKLHGIKIPFWNKILYSAVRACEVTGLGYTSVDMLLHPEKGPLVIELNYQPGLEIQMANKAGLRKRLERVDELKIRDAEHGVNVAKTLFAASFSNRVKNKSDVKHIHAIEDVTIKTGLKDRRRAKLTAKIDTGAWRTSINEDTARELGLISEGNILWEKWVRNSMGSEKRPVISLTYWLGGTKIVTPASVARRGRLKYQMIVGRKNLKGFLVDPDIRKKLKETKK